MNLFDIQLIFYSTVDIILLKHIKNIIKFTDLNARMPFFTYVCIIIFSLPYTIELVNHFEIFH